MLITKKRRNLLKLIDERIGMSETALKSAIVDSPLKLTAGTVMSEVAILVRHGFLEYDVTAFVLTTKGREAMNRTRPFYHTLNGTKVKCHPGHAAAPKRLRRLSVQQRYRENQATLRNRA